MDIESIGDRLDQRDRQENIGYFHILIVVQKVWNVSNENFCLLCEELVLFLCVPNVSSRKDRTNMLMTKSEKSLVNSMGFLSEQTKGWWDDWSRGSQGMWKNVSFVDAYDDDGLGTARETWQLTPSSKAAWWIGDSYRTKGRSSQTSGTGFGFVSNFRTTSPQRRFHLILSWTSHGYNFWLWVFVYHTLTYFDTTIPTSTTIVIPLPLLAFILQ